MSFLKFELPRPTLAGFEELATVAKKEGAVSVSLIVGVEGNSAESGSASRFGVGLDTEAEYVTLKIPTLDGTELWIVGKESQEKFERLAGFDRTSASIFTFQGGRLHGALAVNPISEKASPIRPSHHHQAASTGVALVDLSANQEAYREAVQ